MSSEDPRERILDALSGNRPEITPVAVFTQSATISQMERTGVSWPKAHVDAGKMARLGSAQADLFGFDTVRAPFCVTAEAEGVGCTVDLGSSRRQPVVRESPFFIDPFDGCSTDVDDLVSPSEFMSCDRVRTIAESIRMMSSSHSDRATVAGVTGP